MGRSNYFATLKLLKKIKIMYIKLNEKTINAPILNGEEILIKVEKLTSDGNTLTIRNSAYPISDMNPYRKIHITFFEDVNTFTMVDEAESYYDGSSHNYYVAAKLLVQKLKEIYLTLNDSQYSIISEINWRIPERTIRLYIPFTSVIEDPNYNSLVSNLISLGVPHFQIEDGYIIYLEEIYPEHRAILEIDPNVLIEE